MSELQRRLIGSFVFVLAFPLLVHAGRPKIELKLTGGLGSFIVGDANRYLQGLNDTVARKIQWMHITSANGKFHPVHLGMDWNAELLLGLGKRFSLSIGSGFIQVRRGKEDVVIYSRNDRTRNLFFSCTLSAIPITTTFYHHFHLGDRLRLSLGAGVGYYFGGWKMSDRSVHLPPCEVSTRARSGSLGLHTGISLEWNWMKRLALLAEARYRYLEIDGFKGSASYHWDPEVVFFKPPVNRVEGTLYYYEWTAYDIPVLQISKKKEYLLCPNSYVKHLHEARADFSGFSLRLGVRVSI